MPALELFTAIVAHYERCSGRPADVGRVLAWHVRTILGDALRRSEAGIPLPGYRTAAQWLDDMSTRLRALGTGP